MLKSLMQSEENMDPITTAILTVIATKTTEQVVVDAYKALKKLLMQKFGTKSKIIEAVAALEANPESGARKEVVKEEIAISKANRDPELLQAAQILLDKLSIKQVNEHLSQIAVGNENIQVAGNQNSVNVNTPKSSS
jgi:hypothetical protein